MLCDKLLEKTTFKMKFYNGADGILANGKEIKNEQDSYIVDSGIARTNESSGKTHLNGSN